MSLSTSFCIKLCAEIWRNEVIRVETLFHIVEPVDHVGWSPCQIAWFDDLPVTGVVVCAP